MFSKKTAALAKKSDIIFVRRYPFYCSIKNKAKKKIPAVQESFSFEVTVSTAGPLNKNTGMTANLVQLDQIVKKIFKPCQSTKLGLDKYLENQFARLDKALKLKNIKLTSLQFDECRGYCIQFEGRTRLSIHHDYAVDKNGDLFEVSSQFNEDDKLVELNITNLKLDLHERIIF